MKYIVYLTKNLKSKVGELNKIYIGVHQTNDPNTFDALQYKFYLTLQL